MTGETDATVLRMLVLYDRPADHPNGVVLREWCVVRGKSDPVPGDAILFATLDEAREYAETNPNLTRVARMPDDDPCVVEVYV